MRILFMRSEEQKRTQHALRKQEMQHWMNCKYVNLGLNTITLWMYSLVSFNVYFYSRQFLIQTHFSISKQSYNLSGYYILSKSYIISGCLVNINTTLIICCMCVHVQWMQLKCKWKLFSYIYNLKKFNSELLVIK